jgi:XisI protein
MNDKIWIQRDGTEAGIAIALVEASIPKDQIVLGFRPPEIRRHTDYAIA